MGGIDHSVMGNTRVESVDFKSRKIFQRPLLLKHLMLWLTSVIQWWTSSFFHCAERSLSLTAYTMKLIPIFSHCSNNSLGVPDSKIHAQKAAKHHPNQKGTTACEGSLGKASGDRQERRNVSPSESVSAHMQGLCLESESQVTKGNWQFHPEGRGIWGR